MKEKLPKMIPLFTSLFVALVLLSLAGYGQLLVTSKVFQNSGKVQKDAKTKTLIMVLNELEEKYDVYFNYNAHSIEGKVIEVKDFSNEKTLEASLEKVLKPLNLKFEKVSDKIYLVYADKKGDLKKVERQSQKFHNEKEERLEELSLFLEKKGISLEYGARDLRVSGRVVGKEDDQALPGVNVLVKGTTNGTTTDSNGNYSINVSDGNAVLVFSFIGYTAEEVPVAGRSIINVALISDIKQLSEVVVIGYGTMKKSDLTGSVSKISSEELSKAPMVSMETALQGRAAGVMVTQASSAPGGGISVRVRGGNSIQGGNEPLYVIDGIPVYSNNNEVNPGGGQFNELRTSPNALASLNPSDIESIEVLKDASATAIYGSRGANGVVLVTTKRGKAGQGKIEFDAYRGVQNITKKYDILDAGDLMSWANEGSNNGGGPQLFTQEMISNPLYDTDWQEKILEENAPISNYQLTFTGGSDKLTYAVSGNYYSQDGIIKNSGFDRYSMRLNLDANVKDWFKVGNNFSFARTINDQAFEGGSGNANSSALFSALAYIPMLPVYNETTGNYSRRDDANNLYPGYNPYNRRNPVQLINEMTDQITGNRILGNIYGDLKLMEGLNFRSTLGIDLDSRERNYYFAGNKDPYNNRGGGSIGNTNALSIINTNMLTYEKTMGVHRLSFTGVYEVQKRTIERSNMYNSIFDNDFTSFYDIGGGTQAGGPVVSSEKTEWTMASYLGRINYVLNNKYLFTVSARADGSSKFGKENKWGFFPSAAVAWKVNEEEFMRNIDFMSTLKLRASVGRTGNQEIGVNRAITRYERDKYSFAGLDANFYAPNIGNTTLKWETTNQADVGIDAGFFREALTLTVDAYYKKTNDLLMEYAIPVELGYGRTLGNIGTLENKGIELALGAYIIDKQDLKWRTDVNWAANRQKVLDLGESTEIRGSTLSYDYGGAFNQGSLVREGEAVGVFYGLVFDGIYKTPEEVASNTLIYDGNVVPDIGSARYKDISGPLDENGRYTTPDGKIDKNDRSIIGNPNPDFIYGWNNTISYKFIELSAFFQGVFGNEILNLNRRDLFDEAYQHNISQERYDNAWRESNPNGIYPKANAKIGIVQRIPAGTYSTFFIEDGSYLRLKNVRVTFTIPGEALSRKGINARVYLSGQNLFTITKYSGYNPEVNQQGQNNINQGIDMGSYPLAKTYMLGVNLSF